MQVPHPSCSTPPPPTHTPHNKKGIDCLDRTNVVQGVLGRHALETVLRALGVLTGSEQIPDALPSVEARFKALWADHGDAISRQYAGTGALKSGFTRTGKRTLGGLLDDGAKSAARYYLNNFRDGRKQDALDLVSGAYAVRRDARLRFRARRSPALPLLGALALVGYAVQSARCLLGAAPAATAPAPASSAGVFGGWRGGGSKSGEHQQQAAPHAQLQALGARVVAPLLLAASLVAFVVKNGRHLVDAPQLCPQLANTVAAAAAAAEADGEAKKQA